MGPKTERLIALLDRSIARLRETSDHYHVRKIEECRNLLLNSDFRGIGRTLSVFDAKGSLNDVQHPPLGALSHEVWELADVIRREVERDSRGDEGAG